jgi:hypothetical protein
MTAVIAERVHIEDTLTHLQAAGRKGTECVVLWFAEEKADGSKVVRQVYRPEQFARADVFRILPAEMRRILGLISRQGFMIAAQVHSHPFEAFHSRADDDWAIVRHKGALSLVVPNFASRTTLQNFVDHTATFCLDGKNHWEEVPTKGENQWLQVS